MGLYLVVMGSGLLGLMYLAIINGLWNAPGGGPVAVVVGLLTAVASLIQGLRLMMDELK